MYILCTCSLLCDVTQQNFIDLQTFKRQIITCKKTCKNYLHVFICLLTKLSEQSCFGPPTCGAKHMVFTNPLHNTYTIGLDVCSPLRVSKSNIYTPTSPFPNGKPKNHLVKLDNNFDLFLLDALGC